MIFTDTGTGVPPGVWTDKQTENITFPILCMRAVINFCNVYPSLTIFSVPMSGGGGGVGGGGGGLTFDGESKSAKLPKSAGGREAPNF